MKLGFVTAILPELTLEEVLKVAADIGYDCVEVMCWPQGKAERRYAGVTHIDVASLDIGGVKRIHDQCHQYGVEISALGYYPNPLSPNRLEATNAISHIRKVIDASKLLGLSGMNTFIGRDWSKSVESNWPEFLRVWKPLIKYAETQNVRIGIENCPMSFTSDEWPGGKNLKTTPSIFRRMYQDIPSEYFGLNFDPSHFIWLQMNYVKTILEFGQKLFHMHAKDVRLDTDRLDEVGILAHPNEYHTPKLPGMGDVNWADFFNALT
ncbi:MAG: sugar phosphate isomerase/epimerase family protein, partial [Marinoscillum sp.]